MQSASATHLESRGVGTDDLLDLVAALEDDEGGHGADADLLGDLGLLVDVDLEEVDLLAGGGVRDLLEDGADGLAGAAPGRPEVDDGGLLAVDDLLELLVAGDCGDTHLGGCGVEEAGLLRDAGEGRLGRSCE